MNNLYKYGVAAGVLGVLLVGGQLIGSFSQFITPSLAAAATKVPTCTLTADKTSDIPYGSFVKLTWTSKNADYGQASPGGKVAPKDSVRFNFRPASGMSQTFTYTFFGAGGQVSCSVTLSAVEKNTLAVSNNSGNAPLKTNFTLTSNRVRMCNPSYKTAIDFGDGESAELPLPSNCGSSGADVRKISHTYGLPGTYPVGANDTTVQESPVPLATASVKVNANPNKPAPTCSVWSNKNTVALHEPLTISWSSTNAVYMSGLPTQSKWPTSGDFTTEATTPGTYQQTLTFFGVGGQKTCTINVTVTNEEFYVNYPGVDFELSFITKPFPSAALLFEGRHYVGRINGAGAFRVNADLAGTGAYSIENQREAYRVVAAGVLSTDADKAELLDKGLKAFEWGFAQMTPSGSFPGAIDGQGRPGKFNAIHEVSFFIEAAAHSIELIRLSNVDQVYKTRAESLVPKLKLAIQYMTEPTNLDDFFTNAQNTNVLTKVATVFQETAALTNDAVLAVLAKSLMENILARQFADGTFPERNGFDSGYQ